MEKIKNGMATKKKKGEREKFNSQNAAYQTILHCTGTMQIYILTTFKILNPKKLPVTNCIISICVAPRFRTIFTYVATSTTVVTLPFIFISFWTITRNVTDFSTPITLKDY